VGAVKGSHNSRSYPCKRLRQSVSTSPSRSFKCVPDAAGKVIIRRQLKRRYVLAFFEKLPPCLIGIEDCASSHHWSRELQALGHTVRPDACSLREALRQATEEAAAVIVLCARQGASLRRRRSGAGAIRSLFQLMGRSVGPWYRRGRGVPVGEGRVSFRDVRLVNRAADEHQNN
jgi:hypothetical protein